MQVSKQRMIFPQFNSFICSGDSVTVKREGITYRATIEFDDHYHIDDDDCHNPDQTATGCDDEQFKKLLKAREAWFNNEWWYGWMKVTASLNGYELKSFDSLSGLEINYPESRNDYLSEVATELLMATILSVNDEIKHLRDMLNDRLMSVNKDRESQDAIHDD